MDVPSESNTLAASAVFLGSILIDAITAKDPLVEQNAPTALRAAAIVLICILSAPPIRQWILIEQRLSVAVPLAGVALVGWQEQSLGARVCDSMFIIATLGIAGATYLGGMAMSGTAGGRPQKSTSVGAPPYLRRETMVNFAIAQLFYSSFRVLRLSLRHPDAARTYSVMTPTFNGDPALSVGYAYASSASSAWLGFGSAAGIGVAVVMLVNTDVREHGTSAGTVVLTTGAFLQLTAAFVGTMAVSEQVSNLTGIFSAGACNAESICKAAFLARRFALINSQPAALWLNGFGTLLLAFAPSIRIKSRKQVEEQSRNFELTVYAVICTLVCLMSLFVYLSFTGAEALTDYAAVAATLAVVIGGFLDSMIGVMIFLIAVGADMIMLWITYGGYQIFAHFTHCTNAIMLILLTLYVLVTTVVDFTWRWLPPRVVELADKTAGIIVVCGTSLGVLLYLTSTALQASYTGVLIADEQWRGADNRYERTSASFIMEHWLPVLIWLPLYGVRSEVEQTSMRTRAIAWYAIALVPLTIWLSLASTSSANLPTWANSWYSSSGFVIAVGAAGLVPWTTIVWA